MPAIITIANQKGGVGKTTTTISVGHGLAQRGYRTLLVDVDPRANLPIALDCPKGKGIYYTLTKGCQNDSEIEFIASQVKSTGRERLSYLPSNVETVRAQKKLESDHAPISYLRDRMKIFTTDMDFIIVDTPSSIALLQALAVWAADFVMIPTRMSYLSNKGVANLLDDLRNIFRHKNWPGKLLGVLPSFYDHRTKATRTAMKELQDVFGGNVLPVVHRSTAFENASREGLTVFEYANKHLSNPYAKRAVKEYVHITEAILTAHSSEVNP